MNNEKGERPIRILLIEDNPGDARLIQEMFAKIKDTSFNVEHADRLSKGLEHIAESGIDVIFLDLSLPDSQGLDTFTAVHNKAPQIPTIVLSGLSDEEVAVKAVGEGAQDYLVKGHVDSNLLERSIRYAIERQRMLEELRAMSLVDELTGLYNRRGFMALAQQQLKTANRVKKGIFLLFTDLDNMKWINDTLGHREGDQALIEIAQALKETFRESDVIARVGGDEFAVLLLIDTPEVGSEVFINRLHQNINTHNAKRNLHYQLSASMGIARYDPKHPYRIDELVAEADKLMYEQKRKKKK